MTSYGRMVRAQTGMELRLTLRRGESVLLTLVIPLVLLGFLAAADIATVDFLLPGLLALAVMSTAMTGLAIATGFERQYGVLKRLGATPLPRSGLLIAKALSVAVVEVLQAALLIPAGLAAGWSYAGGAGGAPAAAALLLLGTACFAGLGLLLAGTLRAEATLAGANLLYLLLLLGGGLVVPVSKLPGAVRAVAEWLPAAALADGLRGALGSAGVPGRSWLVLALWSAAALTAAARTFRWE